MPNPVIQPSNEMGVHKDNVFILVTGIGTDGPPLQFIRELTQNSWDAIDRALEQGLITQGDIVWEEDPDHPGKLCIIDNGIGLTQDGLHQYVNQFASSGSAQGLTEHFGIGAKVTALRMNPMGLIYQSWVNGSGTACKLARSSTGKFGLADLDESKPGSIFGEPFDPPETISRGYGTKVTLLGTSEDDKTIETSYATGKQWVAKYLNTRYFMVPVNRISIRCREFGTKWPPRRIRGQGSMLENRKLYSGTVPLDGAVAHWWVIRPKDDLVGVPEDEDDGSSRGRAIHSSKSWSVAYVTTGHVAFLHKNELYRLNSKAPGIKILRQCGITFGFEQVVIYFEPTRTDVTTNMVRDGLKYIDAKSDDDILDFHTWAEEFQSKLTTEAPELAKFVESKGTVDVTSNADAVSKVYSLCNIFRGDYAIQGVGGTASTGDPTITKNPPAKSNASRTRPDSDDDEPNQSGQNTKRPKTFQIKSGGVPNATPVSRESIPTPEWVSFELGGRSENDGLDGRAAQYIHNTRTLLISEDFEPFKRWLDYFDTKFGNVPGRRTIIKGKLRYYWMIPLLEVVVNALELGWAPYKIDEDMLTGVALQRCHLNDALYRSLVKEFGDPGKKISIRKSLEPLGVVDQTQTSPIAT